MRLTLTTAPAVEPVLPSEAIARTHLRLDTEEDAELVGVYLEAGRRLAETVTRRQFVTATWRMDLERFPRCDRHIEIPLPPLQSVESIRYYDRAGTLQTLDASAYVVVGAHAAPVATPAPMPGVVMLLDGQQWPDTYVRPDAVQVTFIAGYGDDGAHVPAGIRHAIMVHASDSYVHRETLIVGTVSSQLSRTVSNLLAPYQVTDGRPSR
ncbi:MAG TPA: hypothetical protein VIK91_17015 [Nannocystis sp.]